MSISSNAVKASATLAAAIAALLATGVHAQEAAGTEAAAPEQGGGIEEVIVTARKRAESSQDVPVNVQAVTAEKIREGDLTSLEKIAAATPDFQVGRASNGSGAQLTLRGIGSSSTSIGIEQSVAVVVDGVYYGQGRIIQEAFFDLDRPEVLKGPQALFFGKNATAGVISLTTADPGPEREFRFGASYEFDTSDEIQGEAIASFPLTDTLGLRVALRGSDMSNGYYENVASPVTYNTFDFATGVPTSHTAEPAASDAPGAEEVLGRVTLKWTPNDVTTATLKASGDYNYFNNSSWNYVVFKCDGGFSHLNPAYACNEDFVTHQNNIPADIAKAGFPFLDDDGSLYNRYRSWAVTGVLNFELDDYTITSVTNWQTNHNQWACACDFQSSNTGTWATEDSTWRSTSTELRMLTTFDGPFNFMVGGLYQDTRRDFDQWIMFAGVEDSTASPENRYLATTKTSFTDGETLSLFGQVIWKITDSIEATAGARYTDESKKSEFKQPYNNVFLTTGGGFPIFRGADEPLGVVKGDQSFDNVSPEATLTWKPQDGLMFYGAYKTGYKSGGFSNSGINSLLSQTPEEDLTFDPEKAEGFEVGMKSTLVDNQLLFNVSLYTYDYNDLQVDFFNSPIFAFQTITADAKTEGAELQLEYAPHSIDGLTLHGNLNYNKAKYRKFIGPCYAGQQIDEGCNLVGPNGAPFQDLKDHELGMAPETTGSLGVAWKRPIGGELFYSIGVDARYSADYFASSFGNPASKMDSYVSWDAGIRFGREDEKWQVALLGKNLSNEFYVTGVVDGPSTGLGTGTANGTLADQAGFGTLPRTIAVRLTTKF